MWTSEETKSVQGKHGLITRWMNWKVGKFQHDSTRAEMAESYGQRKKETRYMKMRGKSDRRQMNKVNILCCRQKSFIKDNSRKGGEEWKKEKDEDAVKNGSRERLRDSSAKVEGKCVEVLMGNRRREWQEVTGRRHKYRIRAAMDEMRGEVRRRGSCFSMELLMISTW